MLTKLIRLAAGAACLALAATAYADGGTLRVDVSGFRNGKGNLACALFAEEKSFPDGAAALAKVKTAASQPAAACVFRDVKPGRYAVLVLHDENSNGQMDRSWLFSMPLEGYGVSNNKTYATHAPRFEEAAFVFAGQPEQVLNVTLRY